MDEGGLQAERVPAVHFPEWDQSSAVVPFGPVCFAAFVEGDNDFALGRARQEGAAVVGRHCVRRVVALTADQS